MDRVDTPGPWRELVGDVDALGTATILTTGGASALAVGASTARRHGLPRGLAVGAVAFDLVGGLVAFQLQPTRTRHATKTRAQRLGFVAAHAQPFVLPALGLGTWRRAALRYAAAVGGVVLLDSLPADLPRRRVVANALAGVLSVTDAATDRSDQRWFGPAYLMKLIGGQGSVSRETNAPEVPLAAEVAATLLRTRWLVRSPLWLYERGLGYLLGPRLLMLEHTGRRSGQPRRVCLEIVDRPAPDRVLLASGFGRTADWYRNLAAHPDCHVTLGRDRFPGTARLLDEDEAQSALDDYARANPRGWEFMQAAMTAATGERVTSLPMVEIRLGELRA